MNRRRWFQFSLKSLFLLTLVAASFFAGLGVGRQWILKQLTIEAEIQRAKAAQAQALAMQAEALAAQARAEAALARDEAEKWQELLAQGKVSSATAEEGETTAPPADDQRHGDAAPASLPLLFEDNFEHGVEHWQPTDAKAWKVIPVGAGHAYSLFQQSKYEPPYRSPLNYSLVKDVDVADFVLEARVHSTVKDYAHRDACFVFGYQDPGHFYYVHFGKQTDDHANQIFIVNGAPRTKISTRTTPGTNWDDEWHRVKLVRRVADGAIEVYFGDLETPAMTATDKIFAWGQVGLGSFDDTADFDDVKLYGRRVKKP